MAIAGYAAAVFIGISLGLIGGGGSILTVPVLVYLFNLDAVAATAYSLFIVGTTSTVGSISYFRKGLVSIRTAVVFGIPAVAAIFLTRTYVLPAIPTHIFAIGSLDLTKDMALMLLFAVLMIIAFYSMVKQHNPQKAGKIKQGTYHYPLIFIQGVYIGAITGLIGAGGGFLIIPVLVNLRQTPMKIAVGTSLVIIAANSLMGFIFSLPYVWPRWDFLLSIAGIAVIGVLIGSYLATKIEGNKLKPAFGWFVLAMGGYIIMKEMLVLVR